MERKFSIPYLYWNINNFCNKIEEQKESIQEIRLQNHFLSGLSQKECKEKENLNDKIIECANDNNIEVALMADNIFLHDNNINEINTIKKYINQHNIDTIYCSDINIAHAAKDSNNNINIVISNAFIEQNERSLSMWDSIFRLYKVNINPDYARNIGKIKEIYELGYDIIIPINDQCLTFCNNRIKTLIYGKCSNMYNNCSNGIVQNMLKYNWLIPKWLTHYDNMNPLYYISSLSANIDYPFDTVKIYSKNDDVALRNVVKSFGAIPEERMDISTALLPDELMTCNFNDCETVCHKCSNFICDHIGLVRYVKNDT